MPRIRTIKPEFWSDAKVAQLDWFTRLLYIALWNWADDEGRGRMLPKEINGFAFPLNDVADRQVGTALTRLTELGFIQAYDVDGMPHFAIVSWAKHQVINRPTPSKIQPPPKSQEDSRSPHGALTEPSTLEVGSRKEEVGNNPPDPPKGGNAGTGKPARAHDPRPTLEEVEVYFAELGHPEMATGFWDHYEANGWKVGRTPMVKWRNAANNWARNDRAFVPARSPNGPRNGVIAGGSLQERSAEQLATLERLGL